MRSRTTRRVFLIALATAATAYVVLQAIAGVDVPRGARVGEVVIGGLSYDEASARIRDAYARPGGATFHVHVGDRSFALPALNRAVLVDAEATVAAASRGRLNPFRLLAIMRGAAIEPVMSVNEPVLQRVMANVTSATRIAPVNAVVDLTSSEPSVRPSRAGLALDLEDAANRVVATIANGESDVTLRRVEQPAVISTLVARRAVSDIALPAISDSVTVSLRMEDGSQRSSVIQADTIRRALSFVPSGALLEPRLDGLVLREDIDSSTIDVQRFAKRAKFRAIGESITVVPGVEGYGVSAESIAGDVAKVLRLSGSARTVSLQMGPITPSFTTAEARALGITELVSSYEQRFPAAAYRTINIGTAARYINGTILKPGETFSMNDTVKERTVENGYTEGWIIGPNGEFRMEQGGAVSTITTAMFNAAWFAGLKLVEHRAHSIYISRYEPGREATVSWGSLDMRFKNNLDHAILITTRLRSTSITVNFWGTKEWPQIGSEFGPWTNQTPYSEIRSTDPECHDQDGEPGFKITVWRTFFDAAGAEVKREPYTTTYRPSPHVVCVADSAVTPKPKPKPKPKPTPTIPPSDTSTV